MISKYCGHLIIIKNNCKSTHLRLTHIILPHEKIWCTKCSCDLCAYAVDCGGYCLQDGSLRFCSGEVEDVKTNK